MNPLEWAKSHPVTVGAIVLGGGLVVFLLLDSQGTSAVSSGAAVSTSDTALAQQQDAEQVQLAAAASGQQFQLADNAQTIAGQIQLATLSLQGQNNQTQAAVDINSGNNALAAYQTSQATTQFNTATAANLAAEQAQLSETQNLAQLNDATQTNLAQINATTQLGQAADYTGLEQTIASLNAGVATAQIGSNVSIAQINANVAENGQNKQAQSSAIGGILGFLGAIF